MLKASAPAAATVVPVSDPANFDPDYFPTSSGSVSAHWANSAWLLATAQCLEYYHAVSLEQHQFASHYCWSPENCDHRQKNYPPRWQSQPISLPHNIAGYQ